MGVNRDDSPHVEIGGIYPHPGVRVGAGVGAGVGVAVARSRGNEPGVGIGADQTAATPIPECFV